MDFYEVVGQVLVLLQRQGRVSYRALKRQFNIDDDFIEDLKEELCFAHPVVDEGGRGLVWTGSPEGTLAASVPPDPLPQQSTPQEKPSPQVLPLPTAPPPEAERRQLTVMFCDLVDSTTLSSQLDPEEYRNVVRAYQQVCTGVVQRYAGHIAQLLGDGLLVYFGYPHAHEDDALRAVHTGLGILEAVEALNTRLEPAQGITLAVRLGIHTGLVVVGDMGGAGRQEQLALGETPNIAARMQGLAAANTVVISEATARLVQGYFACEALGAQTLRGVTHPVQVYRVLQESGARGRLDAAVTRGLTPLVGRESEVTLLLERWAQVKAGHGHVVLLSGEGGIGKSRLVQVLRDHIVHEPHTRWECRSSPYYQHTALYPLIDFFYRVLHWQPDEAPEAKLAALEQALRQYRLPLEDTVPLFAPLLSLAIAEDRYPPLAVSPQRQRQKTLESIVALLLELAEEQPVLFILEDVHWTDPTTLEWLALFIDQTPMASVLLLLTCRPEFQSTWSSRSYLTQVTLNRLSRNQIALMAEQVAGGRSLPAEVLRQIVEKTDGVPLFVEEMTKALLESGRLKEVNERYALTGSLPSLAIPTTLQDSLMARLDRLVTAKAVAQYAAVIGRQFAYDVLSTASQLDAATLQRELGKLVEAEIVYQRGMPPQATYTFKHALIQDAAYQSLLKSTRQQYHQRIAQVLEQQFPETVDTQPELLAQHYTEGGLGVQAVDSWQRAGERAIAHSAYVEATSHLTRGLEVLHAFPDIPERTRRELALYAALGVPLQATRGWAAPEVQHAYARARELCQQMGDTPQLFPILRGLVRFYQVSGEAQTGHVLAEQCLRLAQSIQDPSFLLVAHESLATSLHQLGEFASARAHYEHGLAFYIPEQHHALALRYGTNSGVVCLARVAMALWALGYPAQALQRSHETLALMQKLSHPFSLMYGLSWIAMVMLCCRNERTVQEWAEALIASSTEQGLVQGVVCGRILRGWALAAQGYGEEGIAEMHQGVIDWRALGVQTAVSYMLAFLAEAYGAHGQAEEGLRLLGEALAVVHETGERYHEADLYRVQGDLLLRQATPDAIQAEASFQQSLAVARRQQAKSWELRAAMSLSRLWQQQGKRQEAHALLAPVYHWFTEGFDTADLMDAKVLLDELERSRE